MRTQQEINVEYSQFATMAGDRAFRIKQMTQELATFETKMATLMAEVPAPPAPPAAVPPLPPEPTDCATEGTGT